MTPAERLKRAEDNAVRASSALHQAAHDYARAPSSATSEALHAAAKKATNAWHEVGRAEKALR